MNNSTQDSQILTSNYGEYIDIGDIATSISPVNKSNNRNSNNISNRPSHSNSSVNNNNTDVNNNNNNQNYPFNFPLGFSTNTPSTPSPPPLSPSLHDNINNDILNIDADSIEDQSKLRRSISQYLIINKEKNFKRSSIHQRNNTMQPHTNNNSNKDNDNNNINNNNIFLINTLSNQTIGHASDDAVYRYTNNDSNNDSISSPAPSIEQNNNINNNVSMVGINKIILDELHTIKINQQTFNKRINDLYNKQIILI
eukprot:512602_1